MSLTPEERHKIYEEEKAKEAENEASHEERSVTGLTRGVEGLLCYVGGWISGIVFLVLEQKDRTIRFHAAQSIVVFGFLNIILAMLRPLPFVGWFLGTVIGVTAFVLWVVLMVKAMQEDVLKLPLAGDLAEKLVGAVPVQTGTTPSTPPPTPAAQSQPSPVPEQAGVAAGTAVARSQTPVVRTAARGRAGRIATSAFVIAWSVALIIFLNFFHDYIAYYHGTTIGNVTNWVRETIITRDFSLWLPVVNTVLALTIAGHVMLLAIDKYILREPTLLVLDMLSIVSVASLLAIFPFDFRPFGDFSGAIDLSAHITLAIIIFAISIGVLVRFIKIIVNVAKGTATY